ncbi:endo-exonuclease [Armillaria borealis]|uniref:Endo-exonuclease n=1 Tax=Armillaria borealis TaxID=47425 RepID=A0AA39J740_9AGAR|nr:endo-exonuclease [Armillaria borealis]
MLKSIFIVTCLFLLGVYALPTELSNATATRNAPATRIVERAGPTFTLDYTTYPQSSENICFSWFCNNGPRSVAPDRTNAAAHRASNSCGNVNPNRCSTRAGHVSGYQCDEWPWANSNAGGANAATRCIPAADNTGSGSQWGNFINNRGPQAVGYVLQNNVDFADIEISNVPNSAQFCLGVLGTTITATMCSQAAHGQPYLQRIG